MSRVTLTKFRTMVIENHIAIEGYVNAIISKHYLGRVCKDFFLDVLHDELFNSGLRLNVLRKAIDGYSFIENKNKFVEDLRRLSKIRNYFAHCNSCYYVNDADTLVGGVPHPQKREQYLDFDMLLKEYEEKYYIIREMLLDIMDKIDVLYMHDTETKNTEIIFEPVATQQIAKRTE